MKKIAKTLIKPYYILYFLFFPIIFVVYKTSYYILKLKVMRLHSYEKEKITQDEVKIASKGIFSLRTRAIIHRLFNLRNKKAKDIMI